MVACATCAHPVPAGARFCPSCGTPIEGSTLALEERRVVTVLFADLVGYTSLAEHLDPERVKRLVESCFERLVADIELFGGRVDKLLGDAIVALFGAPVAHEDDAERAVRAGAADAGDARPGSSPRRRRRAADPDARRHQHRRGARRHARRLRLHGDGRRREHGVAPAGAGPAGRRARRLAPPSRCARRRSTASRSASPASAAASRTSSRGSSPAPTRPGIAPGALRRPVRRARPRAGAARRRRAARAQRPQRGRVDHRRGRRRQVPPRRRDHRAARGRGHRRAHGVRAVRRRQRVGAGRHRARRRCSASTPRPAPAEVAPRSSSRGRSELWGLDAGDADAAALPRRRSRFLLGHPSPLDRLDAAGARDAVAGHAHRDGAPPRPDAHDRAVGRQPAVGRPVAARPARRHRALAVGPAVPARHRRSGPTATSSGRRRSSARSCCRCRSVRSAATDATTLVRGILERGDGAEPSDRTVADARRPRRRQPAVPRRAGRRWPRRAAGSELPGSLRALIAARIDQLPAPQRAIIDNAAVLGTADSIGALVRFAQAMGQEFRHARPRRAGRRRAARRRRSLVALPQRRRARGRLPDAHQAGAGPAPRRRRRRDGRARRADRRRRPPRRDGRRAARRARAPSTASSRRITDHAIAALLEAADRGRRHRPPTRPPSATPAGPSTCTRPIPRSSAGCCWCAPRPSSSGATSPRRRADAEEVLAGALAAGDRDPRGRGPPPPRLGRPDAGRPADGPARARRGRSTCSAPLGDERRLADALRARGFAEVFGGSLDDARWLLDEAMDDLPPHRRRARATPGRTRTWPGSSFQAGDFADAEVQLRRGQAALRGARRRQRRDAGPTGLLAYVLYFQRRFDEAEALAVVRRGRRPAPGRHAGPG